MVLLALVTIVVYASSLKVPFQLDDKELLLLNPAARNPQVLQASGARKFFTFLTFAFNYQTAGAKPFWFHVVNIFLHLIVGIFLYFVILRWTAIPSVKASLGRKDPALLAFLSGLIFLVHPLQTESVTYIWQRAEVMSALFYIVGYLFYLGGRLSWNRWFCYGMAAVMFFTGLREKGTIVTLPLMIIMTEAILWDSRRARQLLLGMISFGLLWFLWALVPVDPAKTALHRLHVLVMQRTGFQFSLEYFLTQFFVWLQYLRLCFLPLGLNVEHYVLLSRSLTEPRVSLSMIAVLGILAGAVHIRRRQPLTAFAVFWFFIYLLPTSLIYREPMWEHRLYLSLAGFAVVVSSWLLDIPWRKIWRDLLIAVIILGVSVVTIRRNILWQSPIALLEDAVRKSPRKARPHHFLGVLYLRANRLGDAEKMFWQAIRLTPNYADSWNNLGVIAAKRGRLREAWNYLVQASLLRENFALPLINLGDLAMALGPKDLTQAKQLYEEALRRDPLNKAVAVRLADIARMEGQPDKALALYDVAIRSDPRFTIAYLHKGELYFKSGNYTAARDMFEIARRLAPREVLIYEALVRTYLALGDGEKADTYFRMGRELYQKWQKRNLPNGPRNR